MQLAAEPASATGAFNYGPTIETLRRNSVAETGLAAPQQPVWHRTVASLAIAAE